MGARRYAFNSTFHSFAALTREQSTSNSKRNSISTSNHVLFCLLYRHNSPLLTRNSTLFMNENKRIDIPRIKIVKSFGSLKMKACVESLQKQTISVIFNEKNCRLLTWSLPIDEMF